MRTGFYLVLSLVAVGLAACAQVPQQARDTETIEAIHEDVSQAAKQEREAAPPPAAVTDALLPPLPGAAADRAGDEPRFDIYVDEVAARDFFMGLVEDTPYNMVVHPGVEGTLSMELRNVTVAEVMEVARDVYGYPFRRRGNLYQVLPGGLRTEVFQIDYLSLHRRGISETSVSSGGVSEAGATQTGDRNDNTSSGDYDDRGEGADNRSTRLGTRIRTETSANFWEELKETLRVLVGSGEGRSITVTPQAGIIVVRGFPAEIEAARDYLQRAEVIMRRQVVLEAKILEVRLSDSFESGINWTAIGEPGDNDLSVSISGAPISGPQDMNGVFGVTFDTGDFSSIIQLLETQGNVQVLSNPRVSTVNNQKAVIKVGSDEFFVTEISNTTTAAAGGIVTQNPEVELTPFFSGIALDVVPQISEDETIILHVHPAVSEVQDQTKTITLGDQQISLPLALSTIRESDSIVFARSGQIIVLGGLMQNQSVERNTGPPGLSKVPVLGHLFTQQKSETVKSELVILIRPTIMGPDGLPEMTRRSEQRIERFRREIDRNYEPDQRGVLY